MDAGPVQRSRPPYQCRWRSCWSRPAAQLFQGNSRIDATYLYSLMHGPAVPCWTTLVLCYRGIRQDLAHPPILPYLRCCSLVPLFTSWHVGYCSTVFHCLLIRGRVRMQARCLLLGQIHRKRHLHQSKAILSLERSCQPPHRFSRLDAHLATSMASSLELTPKAVIEFCSCPGSPVSRCTINDLSSGF